MTRFLKSSCSCFPKLNFFLVLADVFLCRGLDTEIFSVCDSMFSPPFTRPCRVQKLPRFDTLTTISCSSFSHILISSRGHRFFLARRRSSMKGVSFDALVARTWLKSIFLGFSPLAIRNCIGNNTEIHRNFTGNDTEIHRKNNRETLRNGKFLISTKCLGDCFY